MDSGHRELRMSRVKMYFAVTGKQGYRKRGAKSLKNTFGVYIATAFIGGWGRKDILWEDVIWWNLH